MCMIGDEDYWRVYRRDTRTAAKAHQCDECRRAIEKGERYLVAVGIGYDNDHWETWRRCEHCEEVAGWLETVCGGWIFGQIEPDLAEHVIGGESELRSRPLTRLLRWQRSDWRDRTGELRPIDAVRTVTREAVDAYRAQYRKATAA
jgi:hypothetical protein